MAEYTAEHHRMRLETPLGKDVLLMVTFRGEEGFSGLFQYDLELRSTEESIDPKDIVGKNVTFTIDLPDESPRHFNGFVNRFAFCGRGDRLSIYRARVVPWLWFLTQSADCRIFQEKSVPDIIAQVFNDRGFSDFEDATTGTHDPWDYCVQYRESDYAFVSRLMEQEGIYFFFRHAQGKHTLVMADATSAYEDLWDKEVQILANLSANEITDQITRWEHNYEFRTGKFTYQDYNFETPSTDLEADSTTLVNLDGNKKLEVYDYPGEYPDKNKGKDLTQLRMELIEAGYDVVSGESICRSFNPGGKFKLAKHHAKSEQGKGYVVTSVKHEGTLGDTYVPGGSQQGYYANSFTCIPDSVIFRPPRRTPKPRIDGVQTAVVVGPSGEEIYPDKYGRVKVQFHWDREGENDEKSSCWIRCAQPIAGKGWGAMSIPRIGQEVVVSYLEGDPDRPLITGVVYNDEQMPPYALPDEKTKSYIKTNSSKSGEGFNEIRFEDKNDEEQIFIHAERNMDVRVKEDSMEWIQKNRHEIVGTEDEKTSEGDKMELVWRDKHQNIKRHQEEHVEGNVKFLVGEGDASDGGMYDVHVEKDHKLLVGGNNHVHVEGNRSEKVDQKHSLQAMSCHEKIDNDFALEAQTIHIKAGMNLILEAGMQVSLKVGGNFVDVSVAGVAVNGMPVLINSGGAAGSGSGVQAEAPEDAQDAEPEEPQEADDAKTGQKSAPD